MCVCACARARARACERGGWGRELTGRICVFSQGFIFVGITINFPSQRHFQQNLDDTWQVMTFTEIFLNIMWNFIPNETIKVTPRDPPWITRQLKTMLKKKKDSSKITKRMDTSHATKYDNFRKEFLETIECSGLSYIRKTKKTFSNAMNKCKAPRIPPLLVDNKFIINCKEKANIFTQYFSDQCRPVNNNDVLADFLTSLILQINV